MPIKTLLILRGLPGAGKTTLARGILSSGATAIIISLDDYIEREGYKHEKMKEWELANLARAERAMKASTPLIIVANVNARHWQWKQYAKLGEAHGYLVHTAIVETGSKISNKEIDNDRMDRYRQQFTIKL